MDKQYLYKYYEGIYNQLMNTMNMVVNHHLEMTELRSMHGQMTSLFEHMQQSLQALKPHYQFDGKVIAKMNIELQYLHTKLVHEDLYIQNEVLMQYKVTMRYVLIELQNFSISPRRAPSFLVNSWTIILQFLEKLSLFYVIRTYIAPNATKGSHRFVDYWLLIHTILAVVYVIVAALEQVPTSIKYIFLAYSCLRMFEILVYQLNVILVHPYNTKNYSLNSYRRMTIALLHNFFEIIFWFAGTFIALKFLTDTSVPLAVYTSFTHMVTYSMDLEESKWSLVAILIMQFQAVIGVFMTVLSLARFVSLFPQPMSMDPAEQEANEVRHENIMRKLNNLEQRVNLNRASISEIEQIHVEETEASNTNTITSTS